jgi:predicted DNA-binding transcriptional regulator YafY
MLNVPEVIGKLVGMSSGKEDTVRIRFGKDQIGRVRDKFGSNLRIVKTDKNDVEVLIKVINNKELKPWILKFSDSAEVLEPADLREDIKLTVERIRQKYSY